MATSRPRLLAVILLAMLAPQGCGGGESSSGDRLSVAITADGYEPADLTVPVGREVTFVNRDRQSPHSAKDDPRDSIEVSPQPGPTKHDGSEVARATDRGFATHALFSGEAQRVRFPVAGRYQYHCAFHEEMTGTIEVVE